MATEVCRVCRQHTAEYTCPRCNTRYCSLDCYKRHSDRCTEGFYRDAALSELKGLTAGEEEKQRMLEILQRLHQQELEGSGDGSSEDGGDGGSDEEEGGLSSQTLHRLLAKMQASGGELEVGADDLTPAELAAFHQALAAGELSSAIQPWKPWWLCEEAAQLELGLAGTRLVAPVEAPSAPAAGVQQAAAARQIGGSDTGQGSAGEPVAAPNAAEGEGIDSGNHSSVLPEPPSKPLPPLSALTKAVPSPLLQYQLLDLLYSYCYTLRRYNGDYQWEAADAADTLFALSAVLAAVVPAAAGGSTSQPVGSGISSDGPGSSGGDPEVAPVLLGCVQRACQPPVGSRDGRAMAVGVVSDVSAVLQLGRPVVLTALMDTSRLVGTAQQQLEEGGGSGSGGAGAGDNCRSKQQQKELRRRLVAAQRKLIFFLAWANEQAPEVYEVLALSVASEHHKHAAALGSGSAPGPVASVSIKPEAEPTAAAPSGVMIEEL